MISRAVFDICLGESDNISEVIVHLNMVSCLNPRLERGLNSRLSSKELAVMVVEDTSKLRFDNELTSSLGRNLFRFTGNRSQN